MDVSETNTACDCGLSHPWPGDVCGGDHPWPGEDSRWAGPTAGPGELTRTWVTTRSFASSGASAAHAGQTGDIDEVSIESDVSLRFDGAFRILGGAAKTSVWAFHMLDGPNRGACLLLESHWTTGLWPFLSMWGDVVKPTGDDEADLRRRQGNIVAREGRGHLPIHGTLARETS